MPGLGIYVVVRDFVVNFLGQINPDLKKNFTWIGWSIAVIGIFCKFDWTKNWSSLRKIFVLSYDILLVTAVAVTVHLTINILVASNEIIAAFADKLFIDKEFKNEWSNLKDILLADKDRQIQDLNNKIATIKANLDQIRMALVNIPHNKLNFQAVIHKFGDGTEFDPLTILVGWACEDKSKFGVDFSVRLPNSELNSLNAFLLTENVELKCDGNKHCKCNERSVP